MISIYFISIYFCISLLFAVFVAVYLHSSRKEKTKNYSIHWQLFEKAIEDKDDDAILKYGDLVIWNENLLAEHKGILYQEIEKRSNEAAFKGLWKEVYYKTHGVEPLK